MKKLLLALCLCLIVFTGCQEEPVETIPACYQVKFVMKGHVLSQQTIVEGGLPTGVTAEMDGLRFEYWIDETGLEVEPFTTLVYSDIRYEAVAYPQLTEHVPFLFADEEGYLRPDDLLTADELLQALEALAPEAAEGYFPSMPLGSQAVTVKTFKLVMSGFFPEQEVSQAVTLEEDVKLTRTAFAQCMCQLLGREETETVTVDQQTQIPTDLTRDRLDTWPLLEAAVPHTQDTQQQTWDQLELPVLYPQGFLNIDGWLYYVQEDYRFLKDGYVGKLYFDENGRYSSGDAQLDTYVAEILKRIIEEKPDADRLTLLRAVYDHCHLDYKYLRRNAYTFGQTGWEIADAKVMIEKGRGNCYNFAAIFWALSRGLGYETRAVCGTCTETDQPHGWCIIQIDGEDYFFDPEWQYAYRNEGRPGKDMFMIPMDKIDYWTYKWIE